MRHQEVAELVADRKAPPPFDGLSVDENEPLAAFGVGN